MNVLFSSAELLDLSNFELTLILVTDPHDDLNLAAPTTQHVGVPVDGRVALDHDGLDVEAVLAFDAAHLEHHLPLHHDVSVLSIREVAGLETQERDGGEVQVVLEHAERITLALVEEVMTDVLRQPAQVVARCNQPLVVSPALGDADDPVAQVGVVGTTFEVFSHRIDGVHDEPPWFVCHTVIKFEG